MHQMISSPYNPFLILPSEILAIIINEARDQLLTFVSLKLTSRSIERILLDSAKYVERVIAHQKSDYSMFTGVRNLEILAIIDLRLFSTNIWDNLTSLQISPGLCSNNIGTKQSRDINQYPKVITYMPRLEYLGIYGRESIHLDRESFPRLKTLETYYTEILNLIDFSDVEEIRLFHHPNIKFSILNNLNPRNLEVDNVEYCTDSSGTEISLNIKTLRSLSIKNSNISIRSLHLLDLYELDIQTIRTFGHFGLMRNLMIIKMTNLSFETPCQIDNKHFPSLKNLYLIKSENINISASNLRKIFINRSSEITIVSKLFRYVEKSGSNGRIIRYMEKFTS